jgi:hypothetical protein
LILPGTKLRVLDVIELPAGASTKFVAMVEEM